MDQPWLIEQQQQQEEEQQQQQTSLPPTNNHGGSCSSNKVDVLYPQEKQANESKHLYLIDKR